MNRKLIFVTLTILLVCLSFLAYRQATTGFFIYKGIELKGGNLVTVSFVDAGASDVSAIASDLREKYGVIAYPVTSVVGMQLSIESAEMDISPIIGEINATSEIKSYEVSRIDPKLGSSILTEIINGIFFAFAAMAVIIFILFRTPVPSFAVILAAFSDIVMVLFLMNLLGIELSVTTFTALLMLLGYSVDTDILLTTRVLSEKGNFKTHYKSALKTGLTMTATSVVALGSILLIAGYTSVFGQLAAVLILGLMVDLPNTWIQNAVILDWYKEKYRR
ncbi:MAG: protein translocase subunit SecF [Candidatus Aenigmatarchaeota archaeon]